MGELRKRMDGDLVVRGMSVRTREAYLGAVAGLAKHYKRTPEAITEQEVQAYLLHLIEVRKLAWSSCNIVTQGLKFFYRVTLKRSEAQFVIPRARTPRGRRPALRDRPYTVRRRAGPLAACQAGAAPHRAP